MISSIFKKISFSFLLTILLALSIGACLGQIINNHSKICLKDEFDIFEGFITLISLATTWMLAYLITNVFEKGKEAKRTEKDILIKRLDEIYTRFDVLSSIVDQRTYNLQNIISEIKRISTTLRGIILLTNNSEIQLSQSKIQELYNSIRYLRELLTESDPSNVSNASAALERLVISNNTVSLPHVRALLIEQQLNLLKNLLTEIQLAINNA